MIARRRLEGSHTREFARWALSALLILLAHGAAAYALLTHGDAGGLASAPPVITLDLEPLPSPAPVAEQAPPEPDTTHAATAREQPEQEEALHEPDLPAEPPGQPVLQAALEPEPPPPEILPAPKPEAAIAVPVEEPRKREPPKPTPKPKRQEKVAPARTQRVAITNTAPRAATEARSRTSSAGSGVPANSSRPSWEAQLVAHLQHHKRFPAAAAARGEQGVALVQFTMTRGGHVVSSRLVRSSGHPALDQETLATVQRAQPLPAPPADVTGTQFSFSVPIRFTVR
jgi:periplasmic protein TonB